MKYKVIQWATGSVGLWALREIIRHPDLELAGLRVYNPDKVGQDAGEIAGTQVTGIQATNNMEEILALDADVVIHTPQAFGVMEPMHEDVVTLLESGKNVISVANYVSPRIQGEAFTQRFADAAMKGGVTLHGTGIDPGFLCDRLPATLTGLSTRVERINMLESADLRGHPNPAMIMDLLGFGLKPGEFIIDPNNPGLLYCASFFPEAVDGLARLLNVKLDRIETAPPVICTATKDLQVASGTINKDTIAGITWKFLGFKSDDPEPFITHQWSWYVEPNLKGMPESDGRYQIRLDITGTPNLNTVIDITHPEDPFFMPTAGAAIRAIPEVVAAPPGHLTATVFAPWSERL